MSEIADRCIGCGEFAVWRSPYARHADGSRYCEPCLDRLEVLVRELARPYTWMVLELEARRYARP